MESVTRLFDQMDSWRHLPNYQLERRADLFFSLYLPEVIEEKLGFEMASALIPEFPVRIGTICPSSSSNKSFKVDYVALDASSEQAVFVELKTEGLSRRPKQDRYLVAARDAGLCALLEGLLTIFRATNAKRKYFHLLASLSNIGLLELPPSMYNIMRRDNLQGINESSNDVKITCSVKTCRIIYVQPKGKGPEIISFDDFRSIVEKHQDAISTRFAQSLKEWAEIPAGRKPIEPSNPADS